MRKVWGRVKAASAAVSYPQLRFVADGDGSARLFDPNGTLLVRGVVVLHDKRTATLTDDAGIEWAVEKQRGCGCGGR